MGTVPEWLQQKYKSKWHKKTMTQEEKQKKQEAEKQEKDDKKRKWEHDAKEELLEVVKNVTCEFQT